MPTGKVKWFDTDKGFGFLSRDDGGEVFVHQSALPDGLTALKPGSRVEFGVAEGRRDGCLRGRADVRRSRSW